MKLLAALLISLFVLGGAASFAVTTPSGSEVILSTAFDCVRHPDHWKCSIPTATPTATPTVAPTATPTVAPTATPTVAPTATPTVAPTATPTVAPTATPTSTPTSTATPPSGGFIGPEVSGLPTSGAAWTALKAAADSSAGSASITCNQDNRTHPKVALAAGLVYARTGDAAYKSKVITLVNEAKASASNCGNAILSLGRQLGAYIFAADYVGYRDSAFVSWVSSIRTQVFSASHGRWQALAATAANTSNNWGTFALASLTTADAYLRDSAGLTRDNQLFTDYGDGSSSYQHTSSYQSVWSCPVGYEINPASCTTPQKEGAAVEDASRESYPTLGNYAAESPQGYVVTAEVLQKAGFNAWNVNTKQVCRNAKWRERGGNLNYSSADRYVTWMTNARCGFSQTTTAAGYGRVFGFTDWLYQ